MPGVKVSFDAQNLRYHPDPRVEARLLLRPILKGGLVGEGVPELPATLGKLIGEVCPIGPAQLSSYLAANGIQQSEIGGPLSEGVSISEGHPGKIPRSPAKYFVIHDTSTLVNGEQFPDSIDTESWSGNSLTVQKGAAPVHVIINRLGQSATENDYKIPWRATKFEQRGEYLSASKGLFLHVELVQPRLLDAGGNDSIAPEPGFTVAQYDRLAFCYVAASVRARRWLCPTFHALIDQEFANGHDDPQRFDLATWDRRLGLLLDAIASIKLQVEDDAISDLAEAGSYLELLPFTMEEMREDRAARKKLEEWRVERPDVVALATVASLARRVEPELLRALRLGLNGSWFANGKSATVGTEAALWFSPMVESRGPDGITLSRMMTRPLREELQEKPEVLRKSWEILKKTHRQAPPVVRWEEKLTYLGLELERASTPARVEAVGREIDRALKALDGGGQPALSAAILKMGRRLPAGMQKHRAFGELALVARTMSEGQGGPATQRGRAVVDFSGLPKRLLRIASHGDYFSMGEHLEDAIFAIEVPDLPPLRIQVQRPDQQSWMTALLLGEGHQLTFPSFPGGTRIRACDGKVYHLRKFIENPLQPILEIAQGSAIARHRWKERGVAPIGYTKGMAVTFARVYARFLQGERVAMEMARAENRKVKNDALGRFRAEFAKVGMDNTADGADTLRHLFVLLFGLGMKESAGRYCAGFDVTATGTWAGTSTSDRAEAGLFQTSYSLLKTHPMLEDLFRTYRAEPSGFLEIFREGAIPQARDLKNVGSGEGFEFQRLSKACPAFAVEVAAIGLRFDSLHWGNQPPEISAHCDDMLRLVQNYVDENGFDKSLLGPAMPDEPGPAIIQGFVIQVRRLREERAGKRGHVRTIGEYQCYWEGERLPGLGGLMIERGGPGSNTVEGMRRHSRIASGTYPLGIQDGMHYRTIGYERRGIGTQPALLLGHTGERNGICVLPSTTDWGKPGCLSPLPSAVDGGSKVSFASRVSCVGNIIEALRSKLGKAFPKSGTIPGAVIHIEGEPAGETTHSPAGASRKWKK